jgi:hypothetical protein
MARIVTATLFVWSLLWSTGGWTDVCPDDSYKLTTQSEVNELGRIGCDTVAGDLSIIDSGDIYNLEPLAVIDEIQGVLTVSGNTALLNLDGLVNVVMAGSVVVESNTIMTNIDGLGGLRQVGALTVSSNPKLRDIEGLARLVTASGDVTLASNPSLTNLAGLESLVRVGGAFAIEENASLTNVDGLSSLVLIGSALTIKDNIALRSIEGLAKLKAVTTFTVSGTASSGGSISPASQEVLPESAAQFLLSAAAGFYFTSATGTCPPGSFDGTTYTSGSITADCSVVANFTTVPTFIVTASAGLGGAITPSTRSVEEGGTASFTVSPDDGFSFSTIGGTCPRGRLSATTYVSGEIKADCSVTVSFSANNPSGYCSSTPPEVVCDPSADGRVNPGGTMDSWAAKTWGFVNTPIPNGKIVAFPFLANGGASNAEALMEFSNNMPDLSTSGYTWKGWFSETPGGAVLNDNNQYCRRYSPNPNPQQMRWSQSSSPNKYSCNLGQAERVLYFNMGVGCYEEIMASIPEDERLCTVGAPFPGVGGYSVYYIKAYPR